VFNSKIKSCYEVTLFCNEEAIYSEKLSSTSLQYSGQIGIDICASLQEQRFEVKPAVEMSCALTPVFVAAPITVPRINTTDGELMDLSVDFKKKYGCHFVITVK